MRTIDLIFAVGTALVASPCLGESMSGSAVVIDGDTVEIRGLRVRLFAIDAPEGNQTCERQGQRWACGQAAAERLQALIGPSEITCAGDERDQYGRLLAVCAVAGVDLNQAMVADGWAIAFRRYSDAYVSDESRARAGKLGLWASSFELPENFRVAERDKAAGSVGLARAPARAPTTSGSCLIKGNHSRRGEWIYHLPGTRYYDQTRAEEMFCTEAQAIAAGYRRTRAQ
jgi:endonuclease YncB( thermonuclease family)